jgi:hypothetical protein
MACELALVAWLSCSSAHAKSKPMMLSKAVHGECLGYAGLRCLLQQHQLGSCSTAHTRACSTLELPRRKTRPSSTPAHAWGVWRLLQLKNWSSCRLLGSSAARAPARVAPGNTLRSQCGGCICALLQCLGWSFSIGRSPSMMTTHISVLPACQLCRIRPYAPHDTARRSGPEHGGAQPASQATAGTSKAGGQPASLQTKAKVLPRRGSASATKPAAAGTPAVRPSGKVAAINNVREAADKAACIQGNSDGPPAKTMASRLQCRDCGVQCDGPGSAGTHAASTGHTQFDEVADA